MNPNDQQPQTPQPAPAPQQPAAEPQPAAPVAPAVPEKSITIKFEEDLQFVVTADVIDDMRFMDLYAEVAEDQLKISKLIKFLIGADKYESIYTYYESRGQKFSITKFGQVFEQLDKDLNSQPDFLSR